MIHRVELSNFRAFHGAQFTVAPLTAFVGPNASGKSSILRALDPHFLPTVPADVWRFGGTRPSMRLEFGSDALGFRSGSYRFQLLRLDHQRLRQPNVVTEVRELATDGSNLTNAFETLTRAQRSELAKELCDLVPVFRDVDTRPVSAGNKILIFEDRWSAGQWYTPDQVSDGTMLMLAFLMLRYQQPAPQVIAVEEPERGLHPYLMGKLVELLRGLTLATSDGSAKHNPVQVLLATQSAELINFMKPEELRFLNKSREDGSVTVEKISTDDPNWKRAFEAHLHSLGDVWLSGGLGGVPPI